MSAPLARQRLQLRQRLLVLRVVLERLLQVLHRRVRIHVAVLGHLGQSVEQLGRVLPLGPQLERALQRRLRLRPVSRALVEAGEPRQRRHRRRISFEDPLDQLARLLRVVELALPQIGGAGQQPQLGADVAALRLLLGAPLQQIDHVVPAPELAQQALQLLERLGERRLQLERRVPVPDRVVGRVAVLLRQLGHLAEDGELVGRRLRLAEAAGLQIGHRDPVLVLAIGRLQRAHRLGVARIQIEHRLPRRHHPRRVGLELGDLGAQVALLVG